MEQIREFAQEREDVRREEHGKVEAEYSGKMQECRDAMKEWKERFVALQVRFSWM